MADVERLLIDAGVLMKVLFLTHRLPYAPNRGDRIRSNYILRALSDVAEVHLASLVHTREEADRACDIRRYVRSLTLARVPAWRNRIRAVAALAGGEPLTQVLLDAPDMTAALPQVVKRHAPDVVLAFCSSMARYALAPCLAGIPFVLDMVDLDSSKWHTLARQTGGWRSAIYRREARVLLEFERTAASCAAATVVVNDREKQELIAGGISTAISVVPNGIDAEYLRPRAPLAAAPRVVFSGVMNYLPNVDAATWLATAIWPLVRRRVPSATLQIAGADPTRAVRRLASRASAIEVTGSVRDLRPCLWNAAVAVAPLRMARGVQTKVVEAVAAGLPVVATSAVASGLPDVIRPACRVADAPDAFAAAVIDFLQADPRQRRAVASSVDLSSFHFRQTLLPLIDLLRSASSRRVTMQGRRVA